MRRQSDRKTRHDHFFRKARAEDFAARSIFKLEEIDKKHGLFKKGMAVLDLGARPGSWLQYAAKFVGPSGYLVGLDRTPLDRPISGVRFLVGDVFTVTKAELLGDREAFSVVLSDMAPDTTGIRSVDQARSEALFERALDIAVEMLAPGGHFVGKLFQGPDMQRLVAKARAAFTSVRMEKPEASRKASIELYVVGLGRCA